MSALTELSNTLWQQRRALERLLYKLEVQQLLLAAGRTRWVNESASEVEAVLSRIRDTELRRAVQLASVASQLGLPTPEPSLSELIEAVDPPWNTILRDHQEAFLTMTAEVDEITRHNTELLHRGYQATRDYLAALQGAAPTTGYSAAGRSQRLEAPSHLIDTAF